MNFTRTIQAGLLAGGILIIAVGLIGLGNHLAPTPGIAAERAFAVDGSLPFSGRISPATVGTSLYAPDDQAARPASYRPVTAWYKNKHWWKRNAPILGGAGGGALVGGLVGGGTGALVGGAVGAGGGYLYKRETHHHHEYHQDAHHNQYHQDSHNNQYHQNAPTNQYDYQHH
jgi:hypothetical protein